MSRIEKAFKGKKPFIGFIVGGVGGIEYTLECAHALIEGGIDILEIGLPFSEPIADGLVIQRAHQRALSQRSNCNTILEIARRLRKITNIPLILFSYYNPLLQKGELYLHELKNSGYDAILTVDFAINSYLKELSDHFFNSLQAAKLAPILLGSPSTSSERIKQICAKAPPFLYYVSQKGTTGLRNQLADDFAIQIARFKKFAKMPIVAGFGIGDREIAGRVLEYADGFVVGSAFVKEMEAKADPFKLTQLAKTIDPRR